MKGIQFLIHHCHQNQFTKVHVQIKSVKISAQFIPNNPQQFITNSISIHPF